MNDPQSLGLGELSQRVQAMSDPVADPHLRPYQGTQLSPNPASNGRPIPPYEPLEDLRSTPSPFAASASMPATYASPQFQPAGTFPNSATSPLSNPVLNPFQGQVSAQSPLPNSGSGPAAAPVYPWESVTSGSHGNDQTPSAQAQPAAHPPIQNLLDDPNSPKSGLQRAINAIRSTLPLVTKLLPLLDGNFVTAISALVAPQPSHHPPQPPVQVDLEPVERGLAEVRNSHRELRNQVQEQGTSLKRVEDQLERVREATDRNTLEQQEMVEDLRAVGSRISMLAIIGMILLLASLGLNVWFLIQLQHILR